MNPTLRLSLHVVIAAMTTYWITSVITQLGIWKKSIPHSQFNECIRVRGINGSEDVAIHEGIVYAAPDPRDLWIFDGLRDSRSDAIRMDAGRVRGVDENRPYNGGIYFIDLRTWDPQTIRNKLNVNNNNGIKAGILIELKFENMPKEEIDFHPHGISLKADGDRLTLYVVTHSRHGEGVMLFDVIFDTTRTPRTLRLITIVRHPIFASLNDVAGVTIHSDTPAYAFYVTNFMSSPHTNSWKNHIEMLTQAKWTNVVYCYTQDEQPWRCEYAITKMSYPNGINLSPDGTQLYVAHTLSGHVSIYKRDPSATSVREQGQVEHIYSINIGLGNGVDNIDIDPDTGDLYLASHPHLYQFLYHSTNTSALSSSQVYRIRGGQLDGTSPKSTWFTSLYWNDGTDLSAVATAAYWNGHIVLGPVFDDGVLVCSINQVIRR